MDLVEPLYQISEYEGDYLEDVPVTVDYYIHAGQAMLDDRVTVPALLAEAEFALVAGTASVNLSNLRSIEGVRVESADGTFFLTEKSAGEILADYGEYPFSSVSSGRPLYYTRSLPRSIDEAHLDNVGDLADQIYIVPAPDQAYTLYVRGYFTSAELTDITDVNWWSLRYPHLLIDAALYKIELAYRNTAGANDYLTGLERDLRGVEANAVEGESANITQMRNSW